MDQPLLRVKEAAQLLKVSKWTISRWIDEGRLDATKIGGGSLRIFRRSVLVKQVVSPAGGSTVGDQPYLSFNARFVEASSRVTAFAMMIGNESMSIP